MISTSLISLSSIFFAEIMQLIIVGLNKNTLNVVRIQLRRQHKLVVS